MNNESWIEKFRPKKLKDVISQEEIILSLKKVIITQNIPHLLFFGPSGCGKTSTILALARELFSDKYWEDRVIELNASDERGIRAVRDKIKTYARNSINKCEGIPPWKIIILDEADTMTSDSQFALRKIMEDYSKVTRFCIICNYHNKIIDPIISRCSLFRFRPIPKDLIKKKLIEICEKESIKCSTENIEYIIKTCSGDLRKAVNFLQKCMNNKYFKQNNINNKCQKNIIDNMSGLIPENILNKLFEYAIECKEQKVINIIEYIYKSSYSLTLQLEKISDLIIFNKTLSDKNKALIIQKITDIDQYLIKGCDEYIQYYNLMYFIIKIIKN
uniref:AAA+ ATPase domain-containing protein n=1 Tax=viral metagenome TaxID=1070528 RepID=A0A6C0J5R5_9ZZZZ